ncbi:MAG: GHKL domain-containing protein [Deltaproteobacteria bacterium]|nr:GHKL domain-containing protein [Deltaproteobacteria bacterium]
MLENSALRHFAVTDGLLKGTALVAKVTGLAAVALMSSFGASAILFSSFLQMLATGLLEVPTGWLSDRFGWARTLIVALWGKCCITMLMVLAVATAAAGHVGLAWSCLAFEALGDAIASALMNGSYQNAYLEWYRERNDGEVTPPPLFLASYRFAQRVRLLLPVVIIAAVSVIRWIGHLAGETAIVVSSLASCGFVLVLRGVVLVRICTDLQQQRARDRLVPFAIATVLNSVRTQLRSDLAQARTTFVTTWHPFLLYVLGRIIAAASALFLMGHIMQRFVVLWHLEHSGWSAATIFAVAYYIAEMGIAATLFPRITDHNVCRMTRILAMVAICLGLAHGILMVTGRAPVSAFSMLIGFALVGLIAGKMMQQFIASRCETCVPQMIRATWLSVAESLALLIYATIAGIALTGSPPTAYLTVVGWLTLAAGLLGFLANRVPFVPSAQRSFHAILRHHVLMSMLLGAVAFGAYDLIASIHAMTKTQRQFESTLGDVVVSSIREPLTQGSFTEANLRLSRMETAGTFLCYRLTVWDFSQDSCPAMSRARLFVRNREFPIRLATNDPRAIGTITMHFDQTPMVWAIVRRIGIDILLFAMFGFLAVRVSRRVGQHLTHELQQVIEHTEDAKTVPHSTPSFITVEFQQLSDRFHQLVRCIEDNAKKIALGKLALQVAHDLRSPLSSIQVAGRILGEEVGREGRSGQAMNLLRLGCHRLGEIANDLLQRPAAADGAPADGASPTPVPFALHEVCDELLGEFQAQTLGDGVTFVKAYHPEALVLRGDRTGWARALGNLLKNALEAMQSAAAARPMQLTIGTAVAGERVQVQVTDTGPGMSAATVAKILQGGHTEGKADGHGIGMTVVQEVVTAHGGQLAVASVVGQGTTFTLTVPAALLEPTVVTIPVEAGSLVLVLDDDPGMREQWRMLLWEQDVVCERFTCWEDYATSAAAHDSAHPPRTVIVDYHFDNSAVDGVTIVRRLRGQGVPHLVLCTAEYWKPSLREVTRDLGITLCPKPVPRVVVEWMPTKPIGTNAAANCPTEITASTDGAPVTGPGVLVIDDDSGVRFAWEMEQARLGIGTLMSYDSMESCAAAAPDYAQFDFAFVDKNIPNSTWQIAQVITHLKAAGVKRVILATGENKIHTPDDPVWTLADGVEPLKVPEVLPS